MIVAVKNLIIIQQEVADKIKETKTNKAKQMGTELIMGMEEVINYLNQVEAENKALKEENKLLKDEAKMFGKAFKKIDEENKNLKADEEMKLAAVNVMKEGMEHKWDEKEKEWVSEEEYEERYEDDVVFLYPNDAGSIQDPEHPEDNYSFGNNCKSKIGDNYTMKRILKNGSIKDCVGANAYCMFMKGGKLYYRGRDSRGPAHVRTIKGEKTTMEFPY